MNLQVLSMLIGAAAAGIVAAGKGYRPALWTGLGLVTGPIAAVILLCRPSRIVRQRLAWPASMIAPVHPSHLASTDGRRTWDAYQPATRAAMSDLAHRHGLALRWREDVPFEVSATYPAQTGLSAPFSLALEKGAIHCWSDGWDLGDVMLAGPDSGLPDDLEAGLGALIDGSGRLVLRTAAGAAVPFCVALQMHEGGRWHTVRRRCGVPGRLLWRRAVIMNTAAQS